MERDYNTQTYFELEGGHKMPRLCFGTWQIPEGEETYKAVRDALEAGYRHIDTAFDYGNERSVGRAIRDSGIPRREIFLTTKLSASVKTYNKAREAINESLDNLDAGYADLYIIHAPWPWEEMGKDYSSQNVEVYQAMQDALHDGRFRNIGLSNFDVTDVQNILDNSETKPAVNQIKLHVGNYPSVLVEYCHAQDIEIVGYSTLGTKSILDNQGIKEMAERYAVTPSQLCVRYSWQHGSAPIVKSLNSEHMKDNMKIDFTISDEDMKRLDEMPVEKSDDRLPYEE